MRFSVIAVSLFAGAAMAATSTDYVTEEVTITSCAATVTDCPARSTQVSTTIYAKTSSSSVVGTVVTPASKPSSSAPAASSPAASKPSSSAPAASSPAASKPATSAPAASSILAPVGNSTKPVNTFTPIYASSSSSALGVETTPAGSVSVVAITTCIPTVIYSTVTLSGVSTSAPAPVVSVKASSTGYVSVPANVSSPAASATATPSTFTGSAANLQAGGAAIAAIFGLAAFLL